MLQTAGDGSEVEESGAEDGVYLFRPHTSYISGLRCAAAFTWIYRTTALSRSEVLTTGMMQSGGTEQEKGIHNLYC